MKLIHCIAMVMISVQSGSLPWLNVTATSLFENENNLRITDGHPHFENENIESSISIDSDENVHITRQKTSSSRTLSDFMEVDEIFFDSSGDPVNEFQKSATSCSPNEKEVKIKIKTNDRPGQTRWVLKKSNGNVVMKGPSSGKQYAKNRLYVARVCLEEGKYSFVAFDRKKEGMCSGSNCGFYKVFVGGDLKFQSPSEKLDWGRRSHSISIQFSGNGNNGNRPTKEPTRRPAQQFSGVNNIGSENSCSLLTPIDFNQRFLPGGAKLSSPYESINDYECYRTVKATNQTVDDLIKIYPKLTSKIILDHPTAEHGLHLYVLVITNKRFDPKKSNPSFGEKGKLLAVSSMHARELSTAETMTRFAEYLLQNYNVDPDVKWILDYNEIHLILQANPDGRIHVENEGGLWKKNRNNDVNCDHWRYGVDLNRNFPFMFNQCERNREPDGVKCAASDDCDSVVYRGEAWGTEQETKAILEYGKSIFPASQRKSNLKRAEADAENPFPDSNEGVFLDIHSHGRDVGWPWGYKDANTPNNDGLGALGRKFASFNEYSLWAPKLPNRIYGFDGSTIDTMYGWLGAAAFFWELGTSFYQPCDTFPAVINEVFPGLLYAAKVAKEPFAASRGPDILCITFSSNDVVEGNEVVLRIKASDSARTAHADDSGVLFRTGRQSVSLVEVFLDCHPYSGPNCSPVASKKPEVEDTTITVSIKLVAPARGTHVVYVRATDSDKYPGPITAHSFIVSHQI